MAWAKVEKNPEQMIYGIKREVNSTTPLWTRTLKAVGLTATASVGTTSGKSDFDAIYPWSEMKRVTLATNDVMVYIPLFYYRRYITNDTEYIEISKRKYRGFAVHPGSNCYIGAYEASNTNQSKSGVTPTVNIGIAAQRNSVMSKGSGWSLLDIASWSALQMLYLVEYANSNSQVTIGRGYCDKAFSGTSLLTTGSCNSVPNLTGRPAGTDGTTGVIYRGIENPWGNIWECVDGIQYQSGNCYICTDYTKYKHDNTDDYTKINYTISTSFSNQYISKMGLDENYPWLFMPTEANGTETTGYCDKVWCGNNTNFKVLYNSGCWYMGSGSGIFLTNFNSTSATKYVENGSRIMYREV